MIKRRVVDKIVSFLIGNEKRLLDIDLALDTESAVFLHLLLNRAGNESKLGIQIKSMYDLKFDKSLVKNC